MMLCHGGLLLLKSPSQILGIVDSDIEKSSETRFGRWKRATKRQLFDSNFDKTTVEAVLKPKNFESSTFKTKPLGAEKTKSNVAGFSNGNRSEEKYNELPNWSKKTSATKASSQQEMSKSLGSKGFNEKPLSNSQGSGDEDWRSLSRALASGPKVSVISNQDLMRIAELRFSTDMNEGDSGSQVALLQKALLWLGHLSNQSDINGYFGLETKQALREFQEAHGVSQTGLWGPLSKQALWHTISAEILHRAVGEKSRKSSEGKCQETGRPLNVFTQVWQSWTPMKLPDVFRTAMPEGDLRLLSAIACLVVGVLVGILISKVSSPSLQSHPLKRRIVRSPEREKSSSDLKDENQEVISSNTNGAAGSTKTSQLIGTTPSHTMERGASGHDDALGFHVKKVFPGSMYVSSLGHGVQNGYPKQSNLIKKAFNAPGVVSPHTGILKSGAKSGAESMRGKQPGPWTRPTLQSGSSLRMPEEGRSQPRSTSSWETDKLHRQGKESALPLPISRSPFANQKDNSSGASNDFCLTKDDGAAVVHQQGEEEPNVRRRIEELRQAVEAAEQNGQAAVLALSEERKRSRELEEKISRQRESAAALEEEVRVLKESHDALLESLRTRTGPATRGASLLYQDFKTDRNNGVS